MSPYAVLDPGQEYSYPIYWSPTRVTNPIRDTVWAGVISEPLSAQKDNAGVHLKGVFGVFTQRSAEGKRSACEALFSKPENPHNRLWTVTVEVGAQNPGFAL